MTTQSKWRSWQRPTALVLLGLLFTASWGAFSFGQKKTPSKPVLELLPEPVEPYKVVASGYVRPGDVPDRKANGTTLSAAQNPDQKNNVLGGTVYFAVLKRNQPTGWGLDLEKTYVEGVKSPARLDTAAEYIYLFQLVNDRGLEKGTLKLAVDQELKNEPISSFVLDLQVPTDEITSWGYFKDTGFVLESQPGGAAKPIRLSASGHEAVVNQLNRGYFRNADIHPLSNWTIGAANHQLADTDQIKKLKAKQKKAATDKSIKLMSHEETLLKASQAPHNPVSVEVLYSDAKEMGAFRVDFVSRKVKDQGTPLMLGQHSPMFGFTSNRPPKLDAAVRLEDKDAAKKSADGIATVADAGNGIAFTTQLMPSPAPKAPQFGGPVSQGLQSAIDEFVGFTAPGNPNDAVIAKGRQRLDAIGATVYFAVLKLAGNRGDSWGTGTNNFDSLFYNGQSFQNRQSPALDTSARYIYLYQLVNDRGIVNTNRTPGTKLTLASDAPEDQQFNVHPIAAMGIELEVDPRWITSWGHFRDTGFTFGVKNTQFKKEAAPGKKTGILTIADVPHEDTSNIQLAASSLPPVLLEFPEKRYTRNSPPYSLGRARPTLSIGSATENLTKTSYFRQVANMRNQGGIKLAAWQENITLAADGPDAGIVKDPAHVQLLYRGYYQDDDPNVIRQTSDTVAEDARTVFRVDWWNRDGAKNKQHTLVQQGTHSPIVGFTSNLPPKWGGLWIENEAAAHLAVRETGGLFPAVSAVPANAPGANVRTVADLGTAVTAGPSAIVPAATPAAAVPAVPAIAVPVPDATATPAAAGGGTPVVGGIAAPAGGGLGGFPGGGGAGAGAVPGGFGGVGGVPSSGGGFGGGFGGGSGGGESDTGSGTDQNQGGEVGGNQIVNFNALLTNQQSQAQQQAQLQFQLQLQKQSQKGNGNGGDVPAPTAFLLAMFGLPVLFYLRRRRSAVSATA